MTRINWTDEFPGAMTVCDPDGIILEMNDRAAETFKSDGGRLLIGKNLLDCHPEPARSKMAGLLLTHEPNIYTIEKNGVHKLIYQTPWFLEGRYAGFVELSLVIPAEMPHFIRR
jgi:PAS domain-containing protein